VNDCLTCIPGIWGDIACEECERKKAMLTESELKWLDGRQKSTRAACRWEDDKMHPCLMSNYNMKWFEAECDQNEFCVYLPDYKDAAEFEARCMNNAIIIAYLEGIKGETLHGNMPEIIKVARIRAEEEMDAYN